MKRTIVFLAIFLSVCICFGQNEHSERIVKRLENTLYIVEDGIKYKVDETRIIAKLKPQQEFPKSLCDKSQDLGFGILEIPVPDGMKVENFLSLTERTDDFEFVDYNTYGKYFFTPNDSLIGNSAGCQWYLDNINAYDAWNITKGNPSVKVAVLDSGVDSCHYDLHYGLDNYTHLDITNGYNYPNNTNYSAPPFYHGTLVAGILGAKTNNNRGIAGVSGGNDSAGITIIPFNVGNYEPSANYVISAINKAVEKGAKIINMSFGMAYNDGVASAINTAYNQGGLTILCATGNDYSSSIRFPASLSTTIAVGATNQSNLKADFSNYGNGIDLVAPGVDIKSTALYNSYRSDSGTSFAAPQAAGVVALMLSVNPTLTPSQIKSKITSSCTKISEYSYDFYGWNNYVGHGLLNAHAAVCAALSGDMIEGPPYFSTSGTYYVNNLPSGVIVEWSLSDSYYNQNCLQQNSPFPNQCTITRSSTQDMIGAILTATIKYNGLTVQTLTKRTVSAFTGFKGTYISSDMGHGQYAAPNPIFTGANSSVHIWSPRLVGATVTYTGDAIPTYWLVGYNTIDVNMPSTGSTILIHVVCEAGDDYYIPVIRSTPPYYLSVNFDGEAMIVTLDDSALDNQDWTLEIYNVMNGEKVVTQNVSGNSVSINISGWKRGLYAARVTVGKEVLTEKVVVK